MAKKKATGLRARVEQTMTGAARDSRVKKLTKNLKAVAEQIEDRAQPDKAKRKAAAKKGAATRKANAKKRSASAKKGAATRLRPKAGAKKK